MTEILAIRHAQASFDADEYDQLSSRGEQQAERLGQYLAADPDYGFDTILCGAMQRHRQTLAAIESAFELAKRSLPEAEIEPGLNEFDHGAVLAAYLAEFPDHPTWRGRMPEKADRSGIIQFLTEALRCWCGGRLEHRLAEGWFPFQQRVNTVITRLKSQYAHGGRILLISSGGVISQLAQHALKVPDTHAIEFNLSLRNSGIAEFQLNQNALRLKTWNALPHLAQHADRPLWTYF